MSATDQSEELRAWLRAEIDAQCFGEDFGFDMVLQAADGPQGPLVQYFFMITMRSPLLGQSPLMNVSAVRSPRPDHDQVKEVVTQALQGLRQLAAKILAGTSG